MCLMLCAARWDLVPFENLQNAYDHNSDGWGIMYALDGRVHVIKEKSGFKEFMAAWEDETRVPRDVPIAVHFRFGTSGPKNSDACHPFKVLDYNRHGMDLYMMHNGVLRTSFGDKARSDTMEFVDECLTPMLAGQAGFVRTEAFRRICDEIIGSGSKLMFLEGSGRWHFVNKEAGKVINKVWYSNEYSLCKVYSGHGCGKAANRSPAAAWNDDDWSAPNYGSGWVYENGAWIKKMGRDGATNSTALRGSAAQGTLALEDKSSSGSEIIHVPFLATDGKQAGQTAQLTTHTGMRLSTLATLSAMGACPPCPAKVGEAIKAGATLLDSDDTLRMEGGISLLDLAEYVLEACRYIIKHAKGKISHVVLLHNAANAIAQKEKQKADIVKRVMAFNAGQAKREAALLETSERLGANADCRESGHPCFHDYSKSCPGECFSGAIKCQNIPGSVDAGELDEPEYLEWEVDTLRGMTYEELVNACEEYPEETADFILRALDYCPQ